MFTEYSPDVTHSLKKPGNADFGLYTTCSFPTGEHLHIELCVDHMKHSVYWKSIEMSCRFRDLRSSGTTPALEL